MTKRKLMLVALSLCMVAILAMGGTLAYLTDTDEVTNTFTVGNVDIKIEEDFTQNSELIPGIENAVEKVVRVKNIGNNDAYVWIELLIPAALDTPGNASLNDLHFNPYDTYKTDDAFKPVSSAEAAAKGYGNPVAVTVEVNVGTETINGITYNVYREYIQNADPIAKDTESYAMLAQVYLDARIDSCKTEGHEECYILVDGQHYTGPWEILVRGYGIQADGFESIDAAMAAYYQQNPSDAQ